MIDAELPKSAAVWVCLKNITFHLWSSNILLAMAFAIGKPLRLDEITNSKGCYLTLGYLSKLTLIKSSHLLFGWTLKERARLISLLSMRTSLVPPVLNRIIEHLFAHRLQVRDPPPHTPNLDQA